MENRAHENDNIRGTFKNYAEKFSNISASGLFLSKYSSYAYTSVPNLINIRFQHFQLRQFLSHKERLSGTEPDLR